MTTFVRSGDAARRLGVTTSTLYSYVSRGRIRRSVAADGRTSLFDLADIEELRARTDRPPPEPATIDTRISTAVTQLNDSGLHYRGTSVDRLVDEPFERVAELLWSGTLPSETPRWCSTSLGLGRRPTLGTTGGRRRRSSAAADNQMLDLISLAACIRVDGDAPAVARTLLATIPVALGGSDDSGPLAARLATCWHADSSPQLVRAINTALVLLADHELATSTLAVRVAASVRATPIAAIIAGLATLEGALHGSASAHVHSLLEQVAAQGARPVLADLRARRELVPGFGHKIYRTRDPRFDLLMARVRDLPDPYRRRATVDELLAASGALVTQHPNIDLALGAMSFVADLPPGAPVFAVARIAGWTAHYLEEIEERPVRYRGLAR
jgi:citrate synthase